MTYTGGAGPVIFESGPEGQGGWFLGMANTSFTNSLTIQGDIWNNVVTKQCDANSRRLISTIRQ